MLMPAGGQNSLEIRGAGTRAGSDMRESYQIAVIDPTSSSMWNAFVESHPDATIFHHPAWVTLLRKQYGFRPLAICLQQGDAVVAGMPFCELVRPFSKRKRLVGLPFSDHCGPLSFSASQLSDLLARICSLAGQEHLQVEIRWEPPPGSPFKPAEPHWLHETHLIGDESQLFKSFKERVQRHVKRAQKAGLRTRIRRDEAAMDIFYELHLKTRKRQGVPIQPRGYFRRLQECIVDANRGFVAVTGDGQQNMSAGVFLHFKKTITYKYGASDPAHVNQAPNYLMMWEAMLHAKKEGFSRFDFGKTSVGNEGLRHFKNGWSPEETTLSYAYFPEAVSSASFDRVNRRIVEPLIKHSPTLVCRLAGEILYKHFAA